MWRNGLLRMLLGNWRYVLYTQRRAERKYLRKHYRRTWNGTGVTPCVIFMNNGFTWHAGLCDRLRAITTLYAWCREHRMDFRIHFIHPFCLTEYLEPQGYDWTIREEEVAYDLSYATPLSMMYGLDVEPLRTSRRLYPLIEDWMEKNFSVKDKQVHLYTNLFTETTLHDFGTNFNELFKPTPRLQAQIDNHLHKLAGQYISISFRFTTLLGDFEDCTGSPLPEEERPVLIEKCVAAIAEIRANAPAHRRVLVTADSPTFLKRVEGLPDVYVVEGQVGHIDYQHSDAVNLKTFLDFFLISKAEKVYLARTGQMYRSAFAKTAALVENKPFEEYTF